MLADLFEIFQFVIGLLAPLFISLWLFAWRKRVGMLWIAFYVAIYVVLSLNGRYLFYIGGASDGHLDWYAWGTDNRKPDKIGRIKSGPSPLGVFFLLPATIDGSFWHPTIAGNDPRAQSLLEQE